MQLFSRRSSTDERHVMAFDLARTFVSVQFIALDHLSYQSQQIESTNASTFVLIVYFFYLWSGDLRFHSPKRHGCPAESTLKRTLLTDTRDNCAELMVDTAESNWNRECSLSTDMDILVGRREELQSYPHCRTMD